MHRVVAGKAPAKLCAEIAHQMNVRAGKAVDGLPVIADRKKPRIRMLGL